MGIEKTKGERVLITGFVENNDYSILIEALKRSKFKPKEIVSIKETIHPLLKSLSREKEIPLKIFYFDNSNRDESIKQRNEDALKYCNRILCLGKTKLNLEGKKTFVFEWWKE